MKIHINFSNFNMTPLTKTEQEMGCVSSSYTNANCHLYPKTLKTTFQYKMTEMLENIAETSFTAA